MIELPGVPPPPTPPARPCRAPGCTAPAVLQWQRLATEAELARITLARGETSAQMAVFGCADHAMGLEAAARIHQADCLWPSPCACPGMTS